MRKSTTIINQLGLHARAAAKLVQTANGFASEITLYRDDRDANAKSIMGVMMLAAPRGTVIEIEAEGADADQALAAILALIEDRFGEEQ
ncbi:MAG: HPr family phosphocarrier protein [Gammaproteobacteria bacterium]|nr:HPr family phosphocarrier protein [Gammaproteobacteria bacterium]